MKKVHIPRLIETGNFSRISVHTSLFWKKLRPRSNRASWPTINPKRSSGGLSKPYKALICSIFLGSTPWPPRYAPVSLLPAPRRVSAMYCSTGPPGTNCVTMKVRTITPNSVGSISRMRLAM